MKKSNNLLEELKKDLNKKINEQGVAPSNPMAQGGLAKAVYAIGCRGTVQGFAPGVDYLPDVPGIQNNDEFGIFVGNLTVNGQTPQVGQVFYKRILNPQLEPSMIGDGQFPGGVAKWRIKSIGPMIGTTTEDVFNVSCFHPLKKDGTLGSYETGYNCSPTNPNAINGCLEVPKYLGGGNPNMPNPDAVFDTLEECQASGCTGSPQPDKATPLKGSGIGSPNPQGMAPQMQKRNMMKRGNMMKAPSMPRRMNESIKNRLKKLANIKKKK